VRRPGLKSYNIRYTIWTRDAALCAPYGWSPQSAASGRIGHSPESIVRHLPDVAREKGENPVFGSLAYLG